MRARLPLPGPSLLLLALAAPGRAGDVESGPAITSAELIEHVRRLSSDEWEGRASGSDGERKATDYLAERFRAMQLEPGGDAGSWFQTVPVGTNVTLQPGCAFDLRPAEGEPIELRLDEEFRPLSASGTGEVDAELVFLGYGIQAPDLGYDDYAGADVAGKIVVVFRHWPGGGKAWQDGRARMRHAAFVAKLARAAEHGALGLVVVNDPSGFRERPDVVQAEEIGDAERRIPYAHATLAAARRFFPAAFGATPEELEAAVLRDGAPAPAARVGRGRARLAVKLERTPIEGRNVCALLTAGAPGATEEIVVVGAHHDHLGRGSFGSLGGPAARGEIHNGADDNASGTSGILEIAQHLASLRGELKRSVLFLTFTGEERGLVGSQYFCEHPTVAWERVAAMLNLDMIGRLGARPLFIGGVKTSPSFRPILAKRAEGSGLEVAYGDGGVAPSDNTSFYRKGKPVLFFFSGMHPDYHRPGDDWEKVDGTGMERIARLVAATVVDLAALEGPIAFERADLGGFGPPRPILGISAAPHARGVAVSGVAPGGPAEAAGVRPGDVVLEVDGRPTADVEALQAILAERKVGQTVRVTVLRGDASLEVELALGRG